MHTARVFYAGLKEFEAKEASLKYGIPIDDATYRILIDPGAKFDLYLKLF